MRKHISQREAHRLKKRCADLERKFEIQRERWGSNWPGSTVIHRITPTEVTKTAIATARALSHPVVVTVGDDGTLKFWGVEL